MTSSVGETKGVGPIRAYNRAANESVRIIRGHFQLNSVDSQQIRRGSRKTTAFVLITRWQKYGDEATDVSVDWMFPHAAIRKLKSVFESTNGRDKNQPRSSEQPAWRSARRRRHFAALGDANTYQVSGTLSGWRLIASEHRFKGVPRAASSTSGFRQDRYRFLEAMSSLTTSRWFFRSSAAADAARHSPATVVTRA